MSENGNGKGRTFAGRVIAAATALLPILGAFTAFAIPYIKDACRKDWEPAIVAVKQDQKEALGDLKDWMRRMERKIDDIRERPR
jgi:hypothetical protein